MPRSSSTPLARLLLVASVILLAARLPAQDGIYFNIANPWNPATPLPQFIVANPVDLSQLSAISYFRSGAGHDFADEYEAPGRSMKHYLNVHSAYINTFESVAIYSPVNGTLVGRDAEQSEISPGVPRGYQLHLNPTGYDGFDVRLFHINVLPTLQVGDAVTAGQLLGYAELRPNSPNFDWAVQAIWDATPLFPGGGSERPPELADIGAKLLSPFQLMDAATLATWAPYGITSAEDVMISAAFRDANPASFSGPMDSADLLTLAAVPEPATGAAIVGMLALGTAAIRRRRSPPANSAPPSGAA